MSEPEQPRMIAPAPATACVRIDGLPYCLSEEQVREFFLLELKLDYSALEYAISARTGFFAGYVFLTVPGVAAQGVLDSVNASTYRGISLIAELSKLKESNDHQLGKVHEE